MYLWVDCSNDNGRAADGAVLRAQGLSAIVAKATEGTQFQDGLLKANYSQAIANGLDFAAYHYLHTTDGAAQATYFSNYVKTELGTLAITLMVDWEAEYYNANGAPGPVASASVVADFLTELARLAPEANIVVYTGAWVIAAGGACPAAYGYPLVWPSYVPGSGTPSSIVEGVTPDYFPQVGGWSSYAGRQFTASAAAGGLDPVDCNVAFDETSYQRIFRAKSMPPAHTAPVVAAPAETDANPYCPLAIDGVWGAETTKATQWAIDHTGGTTTINGNQDAAFYRALQLRLNYTNGPCGITGTFDEVTKRCLQAHVRTTVDGVVGPETIRALQTTLNNGAF